MIPQLLVSLSLCHVGGTEPFTTPDSRSFCTPGSHVILSKAQACTPLDRATLRASVRREVVGDYGVPNWSGADGELDHRVPWFLTHDSTAENLWPEPGSIPNPKDKLEQYVYNRVCHSNPHPMRPSRARRIFLGSWVRWYRYYLG